MNDGKPDFIEFDGLNLYMEIQRKYSLIFICLYHEYLKSEMFSRQLMCGSVYDVDMDMEVSDDLRQLGISDILFYQVECVVTGSTLSKRVCYELSFDPSILVVDHASYCEHLDSVLFDYIGEEDAAAVLAYKDVFNLLDKKCKEVNTSIYLTMNVVDTGKKFDKISYTMFNIFCETKGLKNYVNTGFVYYDYLDSRVCLGSVKFSEYMGLYKIASNCFKDTKILVAFSSFKEFIWYLDYGTLYIDNIEAVYIRNLEFSSRISISRFKKMVGTEREPLKKQLLLYVPFLDDKKKNVLEALNIKVQLEE